MNGIHMRTQGGSVKARRDCVFAKPPLHESQRGKTDVPDWVREIPPEVVDAVLRRDRQRRQPEERPFLELPLPREDPRQRRPPVEDEPGSSSVIIIDL